MIPIAFQAFLLTLQMAVAALTAVASLMVAVAEDLVPLTAVIRGLESTDFSLFFSQRRIIVEKSAYFRYNRTDREIEERSDVEMNL